MSNNSNNGNWGDWPTPPAPNEVETALIVEAKDRYKLCEDWEAQARVLFEYDYKFANADAHNKYQWDSDLVNSREMEDRPCLTINKTAVHNLMVVNDAKQNKPGVRIRPVGEDASYEGAQIFQELIYHIEYISNAENVYDDATTFQVQAGMGYWRVNTDFMTNDTRLGTSCFDQEIYIQRIKDPRSVYLDPNINEKDGSDARFGFIFEDMPKDLFKAKFPDFAEIAGSATLHNVTGDGWVTRDNVRVCEYYKKEEKKETLITFFDPNSGEQIVAKKNELSDEGMQLAKNLKKLGDPTYKERKIVTENIKWYKIAGNRIIDEGPWLGKYVPIVRLPGTETVIDGILDRKGHTRALINAQQIYNYSTSANVEYGALQTKSPYIASADAIEGYEEYYKPLALNTPLPTPNGWTTMGEVKIGDWLFDENGKPVEVIGMSAIHLYRKCYRVEFDDGSHIIADEDHEWTIEKRKRKVCNAKDWITCTVPTKLLEAKKDHIWCSKPLDLGKKELAIDPYVLGIWLGDGSTASNRIHCDKTDVDELINNLSNRNYQIGDAREQATCVDITIHGLRNDLSNLGLLGNKHIPEIYLRASYDQRLELLQGLMDSDGHYHTATKRCIFINTNKNIVDGISELVRSLGVKPFVRQYESKAYAVNGDICIGEDNYRVEFSVDTSLNIFKLKRKAIAQTKPKKLNERRSKRFAIISVTEVPSVPVRCVAINSKSHLFLAGEGMIPTHNTANTINHSYMPYNAYDETGNPIAPPKREPPPQPGLAYVEQMKIAQNEMMMVTGQYQAQLGENENAKSGIAINARQRQGDKATYHFIDNQAIAIRFTGKILIDLIPKIYDTKRVKQIMATDGSIMDVTIDPEAEQGFQKMDNQNPKIVKGQQVQQIIFNPMFGLYDIQSDTGPSFATRRQEAFNALTQIAAQNKEFMQVGGDLLWKVADFPEADILAERWRKIIPPNITGDAPDPQQEKLMHDASDKIEQLTALIAQQTKELADRAQEFEIKRGELDLKLKQATVDAHRMDYEAESKRLVALGNSGPAISVEQIQPLVQQIVRGMLNAGDPGSGESVGTKSAEELAAEKQLMEGPSEGQEGAAPEGTEEEPPMEGAKKAPDGQWYVPHANGFARVEAQ